MKISTMNILKTGSERVRQRALLSVSTAMPRGSFAKKVGLDSGVLDRIAFGTASESECDSVSKSISQKVKGSPGMLRALVPTHGIVRSSLWRLCNMHGVSARRLARMTGRPLRTCQNWLSRERHPDDDLDVGMSFADLNREIRKK